MFLPIHALVEINKIVAVLPTFIYLFIIYLFSKLTNAESTLWVWPEWSLNPWHLDHERNIYCPWDVLAHWATRDQANFTWESCSLCDSNASHIKTCNNNVTDTVLTDRTENIVAWYMLFWSTQNKKAISNNPA